MAEKGEAGHPVGERAGDGHQSGKDEGGERADALGVGRNEGKGEQQGGAAACQYCRG